MGKEVLGKNVVLSITIPLYNGEEFLRETLDSIVSQECFGKIEVIFCDDISTDNSCKIVGEYIQKYPNIKLYMNSRNLGMDKNFEQVVAHSSGDFFWLSGQDDIFLPGAVARILEIIEGNRLDFVFANYSQNNHNLTKVICPKMIPIDEDAICSDPKTFFEKTDCTFPGFLPSFILKRKLWDQINKEPYYGTIFIQLGAFFELLPRMNTYILARPYIKGRIPDNKWQKDNLALLDVFSGQYEVLFHNHSLNPGCITKEILAREFKRSWPLIYRRIIYLRIEKGKLNDKLKKRFKRILKWDHLLFVGLIRIMPPALLKFIVGTYFTLKGKNG